MKRSPLKEFDLTITQAALWLEVDPSLLANALDAEEHPQWLQYCLAALAEEDPEDFVYFRLGAQLKEATWMSLTARAAIPILIEQALKGEVISYGDLDAELRRRDPSRGNAGTFQKYGKPLGIIGHVIDEVRAEAQDESAKKVDKKNAKMPPLEALVVRERENLPGKGIDEFLISYLGLLGKKAPEDLMLRDRDRKAAVEEIHANIFAWNDWSVLEKLARD